MQDPWLEQYEANRKERENADRTFALLGEKLTVKPSVAPEVALTFAATQRRLTDYSVQAAELQKQNKPVPPLGMDDSELLDISEATIRRCLEPGSLKAWLKLRDPEAADPLTVLDIYRLAGYVLARASGLPTVAPAGSSNGRTQTTPSPKAGSRSRASGRKA